MLPAFAIASLVVVVGHLVQAELPRAGAVGAQPQGPVSGLLASPSLAERAERKKAKGKRKRYPWERRVASARRFAEGRFGTVSFAVVGEKGTLRGLEARRQFSSASVVKAMLMVAYLRKGDVQHRRLRASDRALLSPMILRSDNAAATAVRNIVGNARLLRLAKVARMRDFEPAVIWGGSQITARDQALFFWRLRRYIPGRHRGYAFFLLSHIVSYQSWGVSEARPRHWRVYFKGGFVPVYGGWRIHQVAQLRRHRRRLAIAVLSEGNPVARVRSRHGRGGDRAAAASLQRAHRGAAPGGIGSSLG